MTIRPLAFANALALTTTSLVLFLLLLKGVTPSLFVFFFNAQFFGADVASLLPAETTTPRLIGESLALIGGAWGFGLLGALLYNRLVNDQRS